MDIENLIGALHIQAVAAPLALARYVAAAGWSVGDQVFVAGQPGHLVAIGFDPQVPHRGLVARRGPNGADLRLSALHSPEHIASRFDRVVIGSGDGHFVALARALRTSGVEIVVVAVHGRMSAALVREASSLEFVGEVRAEELARRGDFAAAAARRAQRGSYRGPRRSVAPRRRGQRRGRDTSHRDDAGARDQVKAG